MFPFLAYTQVISRICRFKTKGSISALPGDNLRKDFDPESHFIINLHVSIGNWLGLSVGSVRSGGRPSGAHVTGHRDRQAACAAPANPLDVCPLYNAR
ncbi:hypothetical protein O3G_MSEX004379 [Manduca sexta]|uniref:Uncharacterized protein n=1 Tax=Manduca sexta TaxID=7130 RepID=A0A921YV67_MANSE|nr:hypothetical protein O3G_MSEX004379 [Manduca sexta]